MIDKLHLNPLAVERRLLVTRCRPEECKAALETAARRSWLDAYADDSYTEVSARVTDDGFTVEVPSGWPFFKKAASGTFSAVPDGTAIAVRVALDAGTARRGLAFLVALFVAPFACARSVPRGQVLASWVFDDTLLHLAVSVLVVVAAYSISRWLNQNDGEFLVAYLREVLEAEEPPSQQ